MFASKFSTIIARRSVARAAYLSTKTRPFRILGVQQVAIGCEEKGPLDALWKDIFGLKASATKRLEKENVEEDIIKLGPPPYEVELDLMTPIDPEKSPKVERTPYFANSLC
jgi:lactoylglutathione lyase